MAKDTLIRLREGLKQKRFTLTDAAQASRIPLTTLADMASNEKWGERTFQAIDRLNDLDAALSKLEGAA